MFMKKKQIRKSMCSYEPPAALLRGCRGNIHNTAYITQRIAVLISTVRSIMYLYDDMIWFVDDEGAS
jgi:hypothetical protein